MLNEAQAIAKALSGIQATMGWLEARGIERAHVMRVLKIAEDAGRDVSEGEILQVLDATDTRIANLRQRIALERGIELDEVEPIDLMEAHVQDGDDETETPDGQAPKAEPKAAGGQAKTPKNPKTK